jgi:hypothetical protein
MKHKPARPMRNADFGQRIGLSNMEYTNTKVHKDGDGCGSFYPFQPLGEQAGVSGLCPPKHQYALLHALDNIPKLKELLK